MNDYRATQPAMQSVIKSERVRVEGAQIEPASALPIRAVGSPTPKPAARCQKSVQMLREAGTVHAIEVRCSCGESTVVEFQYEDKPR
jgi:hypothetical protein